MVIAEVAGRVVSGERFRVNESVFAGFLAIDGRKGEGGVLVGGHAGDCGQLPETGAAVARDGFGGGRRTAVVGGQWSVDSGGTPLRRWQDGVLEGALRERRVRSQGRQFGEGAQ